MHQLSAFATRLFIVPTPSAEQIRMYPISFFPVTSKKSRKHSKNCFVFILDLCECMIVRVNRLIIRMF